MKKKLSLVLAVVLMFALVACGKNAVQEEGLSQENSQSTEIGERSSDNIDYADANNWAYFGQGEESEVDVFLICPTVDTRSETNSFNLNDKLRSMFVNALDMESPIQEAVWPFHKIR